MREHFWYTVTCGFRGKHHHYEDECHKKRHISTRPKKEARSKGGNSRAKVKGRTLVKVVETAKNAPKTRMTKSTEQGTLVNGPWRRGQDESQA